MPDAAPRPCAHPAAAGWCATARRTARRDRAQRQREQDARRGSFRDRGYTTAWDKARATYLRKHPLCAECERRGLVVPAMVVDHITPHRGDQALFWESANWQSLCKNCHSRKTVREDGGFGRDRLDREHES